MKSYKLLLFASFSVIVCQLSFCMEKASPCDGSSAPVLCDLTTLEAPIETGGKLHSSMSLRPTAPLSNKRPAGAILSKKKSFYEGEEIDTVKFLSKTQCRKTAVRPKSAFEKSGKSIDKSVDPKK